MVWQSILFMFWASVGTLQIVASWARLEGLSLFKHRSTGYVFGAANIIASFCWFFMTVELSEGGPNGQHDDQFTSLFFGIGSAILVTWIVPSIIRFKTSDSSQDTINSSRGIGNFEDKTFFQIMRQQHDKDGGEE